MNKRSKGFSLIEILISLGIVASLLLLVFIVVPRVQAQLKVNETGEQLTGMIATLKGLYATSQGYAELTTARAIKGRIYYDNMPHTTTTITNAWDGSVFFGPDPGPARYTNDVPSRRYMVTYTNVPDNECAKLAAGAGTNFVMVVVNNNFLLTGTVNTAPVLNRMNGSTDTSIHPERALEQCNQENLNVGTILATEGPGGSPATSGTGNVLQFIGQ